MAPDKSAVALLLMDVINDLEFPGAEQIQDHARAMAANLSVLKRRAEEAGVPVVYVNDNYGKWRSDFQALIDHCVDDNTRGREIVEMLRPTKEDYFVLKPKHSGFFSTTLDILLDHLEARTLILTGIAGNICVLFTANDAYMRDYKIIAPSDCMASNTPEDNDYALRQIAQVLKGDTRPSPQIDFAELLRPSKPHANS